MRAVGREFMVRGDDEDADLEEAAVRALTAHFDVTIGGSQKTRRTWLDTFDWRLHRAGLVLEHRAAAGEEELLLTEGADGRLTCRVSNLPVPFMVDRLPTGPLRDRLARVAGIRALAAVAAGRGTARHVQVLNDEAKTVARIALDRLVMDGDADGRPVAHLSVVGVRGYGSERDRVADVLGDVPGVAAAESVYEAALRHADRRPQDRSTRAGANLTPEMPAAVAVGSVLESFLDVLRANAPGVIADVDTEFLHDFRVAVRRTRATLKLTGDVLPDGRRDRWAEAFKWLGDLTTPTRDLDVFLLGFDTMAGALQAADAADLEPFRTHLIDRRKTEHQRLVRGLRSRRFERLLDDWGSELGTVVASGPGPQPGPTAHALDKQRVERAYRRVVKHGSAVTDDTPAEHLHTLRKRCKELRYLLEIFAALHDRSAQERAVRALKALQETLGELQDSAVQREVVVGFADQMMSDGDAPAETMLAMGELVAQLEARQRLARNEYADHFAWFMRGKNRRAMAEIASVRAP